MLQGRIVELLCQSSPSRPPKLSLETGLAMADSIILATARAEDAVLWTQDAHFRGARQGRVSQEGDDGLANNGVQTHKRCELAPSTFGRR